MHIDIDVWQIIVLVTVGFLTGVLNTLAGGGSLITVPVFLWLGVTPALANMINRIPIFVQSFTASIQYAIEKRIRYREVAKLLIPISIGACVGVLALVDIQDRILNRVLLLSLVFVAVSLFFDLKKTNKPNDAHKNKLPANWVVLSLLCLVGFYGGFIQIGIGLLIFPLIHILLKKDYITANVVKIVAITCINGIALIFFIPRLSLTHLIYGLIPAVGGGIGGFVGVKLTISKLGKTIIKIALIVISVTAIIRLLIIN